MPRHHEVTENDVNSPCNIPFVPDTIVRPYWVGMPRDSAMPEFIEFPFKVDSLNYGKINFTPQWEQDTMVALKMLIKPMKGSEVVLMRESLKIIMRKRKQGCDQTITDELPAQITCGRTIFTTHPEISTTMITDACRDYRKK